jgi:hypothetical protein
MLTSVTGGGHNAARGKTERRLPPRRFVSRQRAEHGAQHGPLDKKRCRDAANQRRTDYHGIHFLETYLSSKITVTRTDHNSVFN